MTEGPRLTRNPGTTFTTLRKTEGVDTKPEGTSTPVQITLPNGDKATIAPELLKPEKLSELQTHLRDDLKVPGLKVAKLAQSIIDNVKSGGSLDFSAPIQTTTSRPTQLESGFSKVSNETFQQKVSGETSSGSTQELGQKLTDRGSVSPSLVQQTLSRKPRGGLKTQETPEPVQVTLPDGNKATIPGELLKSEKLFDLQRDRKSVV